MKGFMKKAGNKSAHCTVSVTVGGGSKLCHGTGHVLSWLADKSLSAGDYLGKKADAMHAWVDETIEIGKEELKKEQQ